MERTIIQGIKRLRVLTPYDYDNMDELVQDLSNALEESSCNRMSSGKLKKGRPWKRRPKVPGNSVNLCSSSVPKSSAVSEDSESSLDDRIRFRMEISANGSQPQTDSDDIKPKWHHQQLNSWRHCPANIVESDSVNENFHPTREHRRKRKFKRMAVDPQPGVESEPRIPSVSFLAQKTKRIRSLRSLKNKSKIPKFIDADVENVCSAFVEEQGGFCGKRKRSIREKSVECGGYSESVYVSNKYIVSPDKPSKWSNQSHFMDYEAISTSKSQIEASSSGLSSSESDGGIITNDEGREADDEQSDFFHEPGPTSECSDVSLWWENEQFISDDSNVSDPQFEAILAGSLQHMSEAAKQLYYLRLSRLEARCGREIKAGRRRLGNATPVFSIMASAAEKIPRLFTDSSKTEYPGQSTSLESSIGKHSLGDIKRRRRTPPVSPSGYGLGENADPIPESNIGSQLLKKMGWEPGTGLGLTGQGIRSPVMTHVRPRYRGLGYGNLAEVSHSTQAPTPPPPPPSPQSFLGPIDSAVDFFSMAAPSNKHLAELGFSGELSGSGDSATV